MGVSSMIKTFLDAMKKILPVKILKKVVAILFNKSGKSSEMISFGEEALQSTLGEVAATGGFDPFKFIKAARKTFESAFAFVKELSQTTGRIPGVLKCMANIHKKNAGTA